MDVSGHLTVRQDEMAARVCIMVVTAGEVDTLIRWSRDVCKELARIFGLFQTSHAARREGLATEQEREVTAEGELVQQKARGTLVLAEWTCYKSSGMNREKQRHSQARQCRIHA